MASCSKAPQGGDRSTKRKYSTAMRPVASVVEELEGIKTTMAHQNQVDYGELCGPVHDILCDEVHAKVDAALRKLNVEMNRLVVERCVLEEAMRDDLVARQAHFMMVLERQLATKTIPEAEIFDRNVTAVNSIEAALQEIQPCYLPLRSELTMNMLQAGGSELL